MAKGEILIDEQYCKGCGYCEEYCPKDCIAIQKDKYNSQGYLLPAIIHPEDCNGCGICSFMCPCLAIETYKFVESG